MWKCFSVVVGYLSIIENVVRTMFSIVYLVGLLAPHKYSMNSDAGKTFQTSIKIVGAQTVNKFLFRLCF